MNARLIVTGRDFRIARCVRLTVTVNATFHTAYAPRRFRRVFRFEVVTGRPSKHRKAVIDHVGRYRHVDRLAQVALGRRLRVNVDACLSLVGPTCRAKWSPTRPFNFRRTRGPIRLFLPLRRQDGRLSLFVKR